MRIVDCFPYFNEKELLELRINLLYDHVDKFIICDADRTHSGKPKPFLCKDVLNELNLPQDKIQVIEVNLPLGDNSPSSTWIRERMQRNEASKFIEEGDIVFVSDCDEIIDPKHLRYHAEIAAKHPNNILRIPLTFLNARADLKVCDEHGNPKTWNSAYFCLHNHLQKYTLSEIRESHTLQNQIEYENIFATQDGIIEELGWHFSWMGDINRMKTKCNSFLHHYEMQVSDNYVAEENSTDPLGRTDHILKKYPINLLPSKIFELEGVRNFLLPNCSKTWKDISGFFEYTIFYDMCMSMISDNSVMVEVGSWVGRSSCYVASLIRKSGKNIDFYCVDTWEGSEEHVDIIKSMNEEGKTLFDEFKNNVRECGLEDYITPIRMESVEAAKTFEDNSIDFVHIDAAHDYENVMNDIKAWYPKVKPGGLITGDDYGWDGVYRAVNEFFGTENIAYYDHDNKNGNVWLYKKPISSNYSHLFVS